MMLSNAGILGVAYAVPDRILSNADLEKMVDTSDEWIRTRTGIEERRVVEDELTSDLATRAAEGALQHAGLTADKLDAVIVATVTPDMAFPATACLVQERIGAVGAAAFDISAGCSGFVYGLDVAVNMVRTGAYDHVLVVGADVLSRITDFSDRTTCVLFGDGAGAAVVGKVKGRGIMATYLGADGRGKDKLYLPRQRGNDGESYRDGFIHMAGQDVFKFAVRIMSDATTRVMDKADLAATDIDLLIPHQANTRIIDAAAHRLGLSPDRIFVNVHKYGNTSAASVPLALAEAHEAGKVRPGDVVAMVGFGAGLTWAAAVMEWPEEVLPWQGA